MSVHRTTATIVVGRAPGEVYRQWVDLEHLPELMPHVRSVTPRGDGHSSHWVVKGPLGRAVEWDADITRQDADRRIAWTSAHGGALRTSGQVTFNPTPEGQTQVTLVFQYAASPLYDSLARDWTRRVLDNDLRCFKAHLEGRAPSTT